MELKYDYGIFNEIANTIASQMGKRHGHVKVLGYKNHHGEGGDWGAGIEHTHMSSTYTVYYQYRDGDEICVRWRRWWQDECILQDMPFQSIGRGQR